jgi:tetratricopeptide (TPR) repeat protein
MSVKYKIGFFIVWLLLVHQTIISKTDSTRLLLLKAIALQPLTDSSVDSAFTIAKKIKSNHVKDYYTYYSAIEQKASGLHLAIIQLSKAIILLEADSSVIAYSYLNESINYLENQKPNNYLLEAYKQKTLGDISYNKGNKAIDNYKQYFNLLINLQSDSIECAEFINASINFRRIGNYEQAIEYTQKALKIAEEKKYNNHLSDIYIQYAEIFSFTGFDSLAYQYSLKALDKINYLSAFGYQHPILIKIIPLLYQFKDNKNLSKINTIYSKAQSDTARSLQKTLAINRYNALIAIYEKEYAKALPLLLENMNNKKPVNNTITAYYFKEIAECFFGLKNIPEAFNYYQKAYNICILGGYTQVLYELFPNYIECSKTIKSQEATIKLQDEYIQLFNTINSKKNIAKIAVMQTLFEIQNKDQTISLLQKDNALKRETINNNNNLKIIFTLIGLLLGGFIIYLFNNLRQSKKVNMQLQEQQLEIQKRNTENTFQAVAISKLKSQMNPHFIYNAINSLQKYALTNRPAELNNR